MLPLTRGSQRDQALLGIQSPINAWSQAYLGFWVPADLPIPPPECWLPIDLPQDMILRVRVDEESVSVTLDDDFVKARIPC